MISSGDDYICTFQAGPQQPVKEASWSSWRCYQATINILAHKAIFSKMMSCPLSCWVRGKGMRERGNGMKQRAAGQILNLGCCIEDSFCIRSEHSTNWATRVPRVAHKAIVGKHMTVDRNLNPKIENTTLDCISPLIKTCLSLCFSSLQFVTAASCCTTLIPLLFMSASPWDHMRGITHGPSFSLQSHEARALMPHSAAAAAQSVVPYFF